MDSTVNTIGYQGAAYELPLRFLTITLQWLVPSNSTRQLCVTCNAHKLVII